MNTRRLWRIVRLAVALAACFVRFVVLRLRGQPSPVQRALWLQSACLGILRSLGLSFRVTGAPPSHGLVVSNHLSYLDIVFLSAAMPCCFVSKTEVKRWPYFGGAARAGGTLFLDRSSRASAASVSAQMTARLRLPIPLLFFPEGTSTDGSGVLRFHSGLFQSAVDASAPITAAAIRYVPGDAAPESSLCWFGDAGFSRHLWATLAAPAFTAEITFGQPHTYSDRRSAADTTHGLVAAMRSPAAVDAGNIYALK
jgi:1-acyl-sn-glycerol-3-phosphate acyltransferase